MSEERNLIIVVCTANICRSPIAEKLIEHAIKKDEAVFGDLEVVSAGISAMNGDGASQYSVQVLKKVGIELTNHTSQLLTEDMVKRAFAIFCMTSTHKLIMENQFQEDLPKHVYLIRELMDNPDTFEIPDPYGMDLEDYEECRDSIAEAIPSIVQFLEKSLKQPNT